MDRIVEPLDRFASILIIRWRQLWSGWRFTQSVTQKTQPSRKREKSHYIRLRKELVRSFNSSDYYGLTHNATETKVRVRVQFYPQGEAARLFPGAPTTYVLPAPKRNNDGYPIVNGEVVDEKTATEHAWRVVEGEVTDRELRFLEEIARAGRPA